MAEVNLKKYVKLDGKWKFVPIPKAKGKLQMTHILVKGKPVQSTTGTFYLDWYEGRKRMQKPVGTDARDAFEAYRDASAARSEGKVPEAAPKPSVASTGTLIENAVASYLTDIKATKRTNTFKSYKPNLDWFMGMCTKEYVEQVDRSDIMALFAAGRAEGLGQATINARVMTVLGAMRRAGAKIDLSKGDWPKITRPRIETFTTEELKKFFAACPTSKERLTYQVFLLSGFRAMEVATLTWDDIRWTEGTLAVTAKEDIDFKPKNSEERAVPIPMALVKSLREYQASIGKPGRFVFPSPPHSKRYDLGGHRVDRNLLRNCKEIALAAGLNCGQCVGLERDLGNCSEAPSCDKWYLHKFRHTFATNALQSGVDIKSLQVLLGHATLATTERYLQSMRLEQLRDRVESSVMVELL